MFFPTAAVGSAVFVGEQHSLNFLQSPTPENEAEKKVMRRRTAKTPHPSSKKKGDTPLPGSGLFSEPRET